MKTGASNSRVKSALVRYERKTAQQHGSELSIDPRPHTAGSLLLRSSLLAEHNNQLQPYNRGYTAHGSSSAGGSSGLPAQRLLVPDDCCKYCELYQEDRIAAAKHRTTSIVAWAKDVTRTMQDQQNQSKPVRKRQKIRFLKYEPPGKPAGEEGYRKVPIPGKKNKLLNNTKMFGEDTVADVASDLEHLAVKFDNEYNGPPHGPSKVLVPLAQKRSARASAKRINGETPKSASSSVGSAHLTSDVTRMSSRSCSNELLNVITIDDAYKRHRNRLMSNRPTWQNNHKDDLDIEDDDTDDDDIPEFCESRAITDGRTVESRAITDGTTDSRAAFRFEPPESDASTSVSSTPRQMTPSHFTPRQKELRLQSGLTMRQTTPGSPTYVVEEEKYEAIEDTPIDGPNETVLKAIDSMITSRNVTHNNAHTGLYRHDKASTSLPVQQESRRFKTLNRKLHKLIDMDYAPNRFSQRVKEAKKHAGLHNGHAHSNGGRTEQNNGDFLEMLMDMEKNGVRLTETGTY